MQLTQADYKAAIREKGRRTLWGFCQLLAPDFYQDHRTHLKILCDSLQALYEGRIFKDADNQLVIHDAPQVGATKKLMINMPPQHGKSRTLILFCMWVLGLDDNQRIITGSYNDTAATDFSKYTRDGIDEVKNVASQIIYSDIFPERNIKRGDSAKNRWALEGQHFSYIGAGIGGSITGKGGTIRIIDDPIKGAEEALNDNHLDKVWRWIDSTFRSRTDASTGGEPIEIINHTRWSANDPAGKMLRSKEGPEWYVLKMAAYNESTGAMLCSDFFTYEAYIKRRSTAATNPITNLIFQANYQQEEIDEKNLLYGQNWKTYTDLPTEDLRGIHNKTDTADTGTDYLNSISYELTGELAYITDIIYTQEPHEVTEPLVAHHLKANKVRSAKIESNNGGRGFARAVEKKLIEIGGHTSIEWFHQSGNKETRISVNSPTVKAKIVMPHDWMHRWPEFYHDVTTFKRTGKNKHDDAPDTLTLIVEDHFSEGEGWWSEYKK
jgi:predicted phage terminase large subunit-like protein